MSKALTLVRSRVRPIVNRRVSLAVAATAAAPAATVNE